jgi:hypothetical protein
MSLFSRLKRLRRRWLLQNALDLRKCLGLYLKYGSGPYGYSDQMRREDQLELMRIKYKLGLRKHSA